MKNYPVGAICPFGKYVYGKDGVKTNICNGLCNNCGINFAPDKFTRRGIITNLHAEYNDYEGAILRHQDLLDM